MRSASGDSSIPDGRGTHPQSTAEPQDKLLDELDNESGVGVPILMYHRIATEGPMDLDQFRVDPILFDEQLSALRQVGFQSISLRTWVEALAKAETPAGKPIILTFDDGYRDFLTAALPVLRKHSFAAIVFLVAGRIGGVADWDANYGEAAPLMTWPELFEIENEGIELGCHSLIHQPMTEMNDADLVTDTGKARRILERRLGHSVDHFAYPYGAENPSVQKAVASLGFKSAVSCRPGVSRPGDDPTCLPRIDVPGGCTPEELVRKVGEGEETGVRRQESGVRRREAGGGRREAGGGRRE
jgi:peptidoglycan/xylan/chitin deacetylase (PgdA/CDA1 family)